MFQLYDKDQLAGVMRSSESFMMILTMRTVTNTRWRSESLREKIKFLKSDIVGLLTT